MWLKLQNSVIQKPPCISIRIPHLLDPNADARDKQDGYAHDNPNAK